MYKEDAVLLPQASLDLEWVGWALERRWSVKNRPWRVMQKSPVHPLEPVNCNNPLWSCPTAGQSRTLASCLSWAGLDTCHGARGGMPASCEAARSSLRAGDAGAQLVQASAPWPLLCGFPDSAALTCPRAQSHWQNLVASCREMFSSTLSLPPACQ